MQRKARFSAATSGGSATISITIPGTFTTISTYLPTFSGRVISKVSMFFGSPADGDYCAGFTVTDPNGVIPAGVQSQIPTYPTIFSFTDPGSPTPGSPGFYLNPNAPTEFIPIQNYGTIPSGLVLSAIFTKATALLGDTIYLNVEWDDLTAIA